MLQSSTQFNDRVYTMTEARNNDTALFMDERTNLVIEIRKC